MESHPPRAGRGALASASHSKSYDPSAPWRAMINPPPSIPTDISSNEPYSSNLPQGRKTRNNGRLSRATDIQGPIYHLSPNSTEKHHSNQPTFTGVNTRLPSAPPPVIDRAMSYGIIPYAQPTTVTGNPYGAGPYYPYSAPYLVPMTTNLPVEKIAVPEEPSRSEILTRQKKEGDLNRLEVYHFSPKKPPPSYYGTTIVPTTPGPYISPYNPYPYTTLPVAPTVPQVPYATPPYDYPWYGYPYYPSSYPTDPSVPFLPFIETKARSIQTDAPRTQSRGSSPINVSEVRFYRSGGYPSVRYVPPPPPLVSRPPPLFSRPPEPLYRYVHDRHQSMPRLDCRCIECQRDRQKVLNYYPEWN